MIGTLIDIYFYYLVGICILYTIIQFFGSADSYSLIPEQIYCEKCDTITAKSGYSNKICKKCLRGS